MIEMIGEEKVKSILEFMDVLNYDLETNSERIKLWTPSNLKRQEERQP